MDSLSGLSAQRIDVVVDGIGKFVLSAHRFFKCGGTTVQILDLFVLVAVAALHTFRSIIDDFDAGVDTL